MTKLLITRPRYSQTKTAKTYLKFDLTMVEEPTGRFIVIKNCLAVRSSKGKLKVKGPVRVTNSGPQTDVFFSSEMFDYLVDIIEERWGDGITSRRFKKLILKA